MAMIINDTASNLPAGYEGLSSAGTPISRHEVASTRTYFCCLIYAILICSIPWPTIHEYIYGYPFVDRTVYIDSFKYSEADMGYQDYNNIVSSIINEYAWHFGISYLTDDIGLS